MGKGWGGCRKGSGRKTVPEELKKKGHTFYLTDEEIKYIESFPGRTKSEKLRNLIKRAKEAGINKN